jgi:hypothetical protein
VILSETMAFDDEVHGTDAAEGGIYSGIFKSRETP